MKRRNVFTRALAAAAAICLILLTASCQTAPKTHEDTWVTPQSERDFTGKWVGSSVIPYTIGSGSTMIKAECGLEITLEYPVDRGDESYMFIKIVMDMSPMIHLLGNADQEGAVWLMLRQMLGDYPETAADDGSISSQESSVSEPYTVTWTTLSPDVTFNAENNTETNYILINTQNTKLKMSMELGLDGENGPQPVVLILDKQ